MYSSEIEQILKFQYYSIDSKTYTDICNTSPQISRVKYDSFANKYEIWTTDNFYWKFNVYKEENEL